MEDTSSRKDSKLKRLYADRNGGMSILFEYGEADGFHLVEASFVEMGVSNFYQTWSVRRHNGSWNMEVRSESVGCFETRYSEKAGGTEAIAKDRLVKKILAEYKGYQYVRPEKLEAALRKNLGLTN